jgi:hypothetical protein
VAHQISNGLNAAAFDGRSLNELQAVGWIVQSQALIALANALASS